MISQTILRKSKSVTFAPLPSETHTPVITSKDDSNAIPTVNLPLYSLETNLSQLILLKTDLEDQNALSGRPKATRILDKEIKTVQKLIKKKKSFIKKGIKKVKSTLF
jgi:hypothetical protein